MQSNLAQLDVQIPEREVQTIDACVLPLINYIRVIALKCRAAPSTDMFEACSILSTDKTIARTAHAETLVRCFREATGKSPKLHRAGTEELTFDESWIARLALAAAHEDDDSFRFLIQSRVPKESRRHMAFLVRSIADQFTLN